jgi:hypothetical protein
LGAKFLVVLCAGSTLLLVQSKALDEALNKLSGAVAKLAGITFSSLAFSYWFDKPWFLSEGKLAIVLIIPSYWGSQLGGHLHQHRTAIKLFSGAVAREKEDFCKGSFARTSFTCLLFCFILFLLASFYQKYKKIVSFIVVTLLLLVHYVVP